MPSLHKKKQENKNYEDLPLSLDLEKDQDIIQ